MHTSTDDLSEKLQELQDGIQKLQLLKQLGLENLILKQEREVQRIQEDIHRIDKDTTLDIMDTLPRKCRFCTEHDTEDARLACWEENHEKCDRKDLSMLNPLSVSFLRVLAVYGIIMMLLICFLITTQIFFQYISIGWVVFLMSAGVIGMISVAFRKPVQHLMNILK